MEKEGDKSSEVGRLPQLTLPGRRNVTQADDAQRSGNGRRVTRYSCTERNIRVASTLIQLYRDARSDHLYRVGLELN